MQIAGVCRFSMLGRGDWKAYRNQPDEALEAIYEAKAAELFEPERMEARLSTFRHLTLASMAAQTDQNFVFIVISSDRMPDEYRRRLEQLCASVPQVVLRFVPPMHVSEAAGQIFDELGLQRAELIQFRLDDDDCVSREYIRRLQRVGTMLKRQGIFGVSFSQQYYCVTDGPTEGVYDWYAPFFSAGAAIRHPRMTIFDYGHFSIPRRMMTVSDPHFPNLVTHRGDNDTPRHAREILKKRGMFSAPADDVAKVFRKHFDFITPEALKACGLAHLIDLKSGVMAPAGASTGRETDHEALTGDEQVTDEAPPAPAPVGKTSAAGRVKKDKTRK